LVMKTVVHPRMSLERNAKLIEMPDLEWWCTWTHPMRKILLLLADFVKMGLTNSFCLRRTAGRMEPWELTI
jgi:hypothetical protein